MIHLCTSKHYHVFTQFYGSFVSNEKYIEIKNMMTNIKKDLSRKLLRM